ncbi:hypothetical protein [Cetobacterium sp.]|uniref:hypothetical protein n=1 Tax=Cetobacterium sp. TaxID=2071632 RepID=UPI003F2C59AC
MLKKIKGMFKSEELEKELEGLRIKCDFLKRNEIKRASAYDILLKENLEKESLEKTGEIIKLKEEFQKLENAYSEEYAKRLKAKLKIYEDTYYTKVKELESDLLSTKNEYSLYFEKEKNKWISELEKSANSSKSIVASLKKELEVSEEKVKIEKSDNLKKCKELEELKLKLSLESSKFANDLLAEKSKLSLELEKTAKSSKAVVESLKKELEVSEEKVKIEKSDNLKKCKELEELKLKLSSESSKFANDLLSEKNKMSLELEKTVNNSKAIVESLKKELEVSEEKVKIEKTDNLKKCKELEELKLKLSSESSKFASDLLAEKSKISLELEKTVNNSKAIVESLKKELEVSEEKVKIEKSDNLKKCKELEELKLKLSLESSKFASDLLSEKNKMSLELEKKVNSSKAIVESLKKALEVSEEKVKIEKSDNLKKCKELEELKLKLSLESSKFASDLLAEKNKMSLELEKTVNNSKAIVESLEKGLEISEEEENSENPVNLNKFKEVTKSRTTASYEKTEEYNFKGNWANKEKFFKNKNDLLNLMKSFSENDFKEMYLEGKKRGLLKIVKDRDFSNVLTRLKLKLPLTIMSLEKLEVFYENLMEDIYPQKILGDAENILETPIKEEIEIQEFSTKSKTKDKINNYGEWANYEKYCLNKGNLITIITRFSLDDFKEIYSESVKRNILTQMEAAKILSVINWLKMDVPLDKLNIKKIEEIYCKIIQNLYEKEDVIVEKNKISGIENNLPEVDYKEDKKNTVKIKLKTFNDISNQALKEGIVEMKELEVVNFDNEDEVYDIYEAIEILEKRGVRINY